MTTSCTLRPTASRASCSPFQPTFTSITSSALSSAASAASPAAARNSPLRAGDLLLLNPGDSHACEQRGGETLDYRSLTITQNVMRSLSEEITGTDTLPRFSPNVLRDSEAACDFRTLHELVLSRSREFEKEEALLLLLSRLFERCASPFAAPQPPRGEIDAACAFMQRHFAERITLDRLCRCAHLSKSTLLRAFTREKGVTPYRYLEAVRIGEAKSS